jgi:hypothetical protein
LQIHIPAYRIFHIILIFKYNITFTYHISHKTTYFSSFNFSYTLSLSLLFFIHTITFYILIFSNLFSIHHTHFLSSHKTSTSYLINIHIFLSSITTYHYILNKTYQILNHIKYYFSIFNSSSHFIYPLQFNLHSQKNTLITFNLNYTKFLKYNITSTSFHKTFQYL